MIFFSFARLFVYFFARRSASCSKRRCQDSGDAWFWRRVEQQITCITTGVSHVEKSRKTIDDGAFSTESGQAVFSDAAI